MKRPINNSVIVILLFGTAIYLPSSNKETNLADMTSYAYSNITQTSALTVTTLPDDGVTEVTSIMVCWSITPNPTTIFNNSYNSGKLSFGMA